MRHSGVAWLLRPSGRGLEKPVEPLTSPLTYLLLAHGVSLSGQRHGGETCRPGKGCECAAAVRRCGEDAGQTQQPASARSPVQARRARSVKLRILRLMESLVVVRVLVSWPTGRPFYTPHHTFLEPTLKSSGA